MRKPTIPVMAITETTAVPVTARMTVAMTNLESCMSNYNSLAPHVRTMNGIVKNTVTCLLAQGGSHPGNLSYCSYFESMIHFYWILQRVNVCVCERERERDH